VDLIEPALTTPRKHEDHIALVLDMLFVQVYKAHVSVRFLAEIGHMEDAATIARRLLELSVFAGYISFPSREEERTARADRYLGNLWHELPPEGRAVLPNDIRTFWESIAGGVPRGGLPSFQKMFAEIDKHETYAKDYRLLTGIAHGSSSDQLIAFAHRRVPVRPHWHLGALLVFASRYAVGLALLWNDIYKIIETAALQSLVDDLTQWPEGRPDPEATPPAEAP